MAVQPLMLWHRGINNKKLESPLLPQVFASGLMLSNSISINLHMKKILLFLLLLCTINLYANQSKRISLLGTWKGNYDTLNAVLKFNINHTGSVKWSNSEKIYLFKYFFKNKSILCIYGRSGKNYH